MAPPRWRPRARRAPHAAALTITQMQQVGVAVALQDKRTKQWTPKGSCRAEILMPRGQRALYRPSFLPPPPPPPPVSFLKTCATPLTPLLRGFSTAKAL